MNPSKQQRMQLFLQSNYDTLPQLAHNCGLSTAEVLNLETAQCIPGHTYEMRQILIFSCAGIDDALTENTDLTTNWYYHKSINLWVKEALCASKNMSLSDVAAQVKDNFAKQLSNALGGIKTPGCQNFEQAWAYWIDGTWGKCLKEISVNCLARKELSRYHIAEIMQQNPAEICEDTRIKLHNAVTNYIDASLDFDAYGTRHLLAEDAIEKFQLNIKINKKYLNDKKAEML